MGCWCWIELIDSSHYVLSCVSCHSILLQALMREVRKVFGDGDGGGDGKKAGKRMVIEEVENKGEDEVSVGGKDTGTQWQTKNGAKSANTQASKHSATTTAGTKNSTLLAAATKTTSPNSSPLRTTETSDSLAKVLTAAAHAEGVGQYGKAVTLYTQAINMPASPSDNGSFRVFIIIIIIIQK